MGLPRRRYLVFDTKKKSKYQSAGMLNITQLAGQRQEEGRGGGRGGGAGQWGVGVEKSRVAGAERQYLYFCSGEASKVSTGTASPRNIDEAQVMEERECTKENTTKYFCTSKSSKLKVHEGAHSQVLLYQQIQ